MAANLEVDTFCIFVYTVLTYAVNLDVNFVQGSIRKLNTYFVALLIACTHSWKTGILIVNKSAREASLYTSFLDGCSADPSALLSILHRKLTPKMAAELMRFI